MSNGLSTFIVSSLLLSSASYPQEEGKLLQPPDAAIEVDIPATFDWTDETADVWLLEVSEEEDFTQLVISDTQYSSQFTTSNLADFRQYYWRVRYGNDLAGGIVWGDYTESHSFQTAIDGCCEGCRGNIDGDSSDAVDIADLVYLVGFMFTGGPSLPCLDEGDINPIAWPDGSLDISDLVALVTYMFQGGPAPGPCPSLISIVALEYGADTVRGSAHILDTTRHKVVLWAKTDRWYVQPYTISPYTVIQGDGSWSSFTNSWDRIVALLVDSSYVPDSIRAYHPSTDPGVIGWDEYPARSIHYIDWSGYRWRIKDADLVGPGPNYFSDDTANVWTDASDRLHLKIDRRDSIWYCAEVILDQNQGYGVYSFKLDSRVDSLGFNTIFAGFLYETINQEFDMEFSQRLADPFNSQYVVQPWYNPGNIEFYNMPVLAWTSHSLEWRPDRIVFESWRGHADTSTPETLIHSWTYTGDDIPLPGGERMIFNLYLFGGEPPASGTGDEVIIESFQYRD